MESKPFACNHSRLLRNYIDELDDSEWCKVGNSGQLTEKERVNPMWSFSMGCSLYTPIQDSFSAFSLINALSSNSCLFIFKECLFHETYHSSYQKICWLFWFWGNTRLCSEFTLGSVSRDHSWQCLRDHMECRGMEHWSIVCKYLPAVLLLWPPYQILLDLAPLQQRTLWSPII